MQNYVDSIRKVSEIIDREGPNFIIAPMMGSVPLIDALNLVNPGFNNDPVFYMPASSHLPNVNGIMRNWVGNFLDDKVSFEEPIKILTIDEAVSGQSSVRVHRAWEREINAVKKYLVSELMKPFGTLDSDEFNQAVSNLNELTGHEYYGFLQELSDRQSDWRTDSQLMRTYRTELVDIVKDFVSALIELKGIGFEDEKNKGKRSKEYKDLRDSSKIIGVPVKKILTMDRPELCSANYTQLNGVSNKNHVRFSPIVQLVGATRSYANFFRDLAGVAGSNPDSIHPFNITKIYESSKFLSTKC